MMVTMTKLTFDDEVKKRKTDPDATFPQHCQVRRVDDVAKDDAEDDEKHSQRHNGPRG